MQRDFILENIKVIALTGTVMKYFNRISKNNYNEEPLLKSNCTSSFRSEQQNGFLIRKLYNNIIRLKKNYLTTKCKYSGDTWTPSTLYTLFFVLLVPALD